jgi:hypothetical protein
MDTTTKRPQPLVNLGSSLRDQLESVGASMTPPMRWQDLARQVIKNFVHSQVLAGALQDAQVRLPEGTPHVMHGFKNAKLTDKQRENEQREVDVEDALS